MSQTSKPLVYRGSKEICEAVGLDYKGMAKHVKDLGLPAFKIEGQKAWLACPEDLQRWIREQRDKCLTNS